MRCLEISITCLTLLLLGCKREDPFGDTACIGRLRMIEGAKDQYRLHMLEQHKTPNEAATWNDIRGYITRQGKVVPTCPRGGTHSLGRLGEPPRCSIPVHKIP